MEKQRRARTPQTDLSPWRFSQHLQCKINLLWVKGLSKLYGKVCQNVLREICTFISFHPFLVAESGTSIILYDVKRRSKKVLRYEDIELYEILPMKFGLICIGDNQVFLCGGTHYVGVLPKCAYLLDANYMLPLEDMRFARCRPALYYDEESLSIMAFGGTGRTGKCERFWICKRKWAKLPEMMAARRTVSICGSAGKVYICERWNELEIFTIATEQFTVLKNFRVCFWRTIFPSLTMWEGQLLFLYEKKMLCYDLLAKEEKEVKKLNEVSEKEKFPSIIDGSVYYKLDGRWKTLSCVDMRNATRQIISLA